MPAGGAPACARHAAAGGVMHESNERVRRAARCEATREQAPAGAGGCWRDARARLRCGHLAAVVVVAGLESVIQALRADVLDAAERKDGAARSGTA